MRLGIVGFSLILFAGIGLIPISGKAQTDNDRKTIEETVGYYFTGIEAKDIETMRKAFHPDAKMMYIHDGKLTQVTMPEWFERIKNNPAPPQKANYRKIVLVDISGNAATVKAESDFATFQFLDYLSLLKIDGEWRIINKIFYRKEK